MIRFQNIHLLPLVWLIVAAIPLLVGEFYLKRKQQRNFSPSPGKGLAKDQVRRTVWLLLALFSLVLAIWRPSWNPSMQVVEQQGRDVVFLLDVSRSMTADDVAPSRLERAKLEIAETVQVVKGDRIALVAFAGNSVVKCPLTMDYGFFDMILKDVSPLSVSRGGSQLGDALRRVESQVFDDQAREQRDIILITDGEDQDSYPVEAAKSLGSRGVRLIIIGLGDSLQGARVMDGEGNYLTYQGKEVWSRMDGDTLRKMAAATPGGRYLEAGQANFSLPRIYQSLISSSKETSAGEEETYVYEEKFQLFILLAIIFITGEALRVMGPVDYRKIWGQFRNRALTKGLLLVFLLPLGFAFPLHGEGRADLYMKGEKALEGEDWEGFDRIYDRLTEKGADRDKTDYNRARSLYRQGSFKEAADLFGKAGAGLEGKQAARALYNRGNALMELAGTNPQSGAYDQAAEAYLKALELDPSFTEAARNLEILKSQEPPPQEESPGESDGDENGSDGDDRQKDGEGDNPSEGGDSRDEPSRPDSPSEEVSQEEEQNGTARDILDREEENREEREDALRQIGGMYHVERDW